MGDWSIVETGAVTFGPAPWSSSVFSSELIGRGLSVSLPVSEPSPTVIVHNGASLYPVTDSHPTPFDSSYEEYTGPTTEVRTTDVLATYGKQDKSKTVIFDEKKIATWNKRDQVLISGWEASSGNVFETGYYDLIKFTVTLACLNGSLISEVGGDLDDLKAWRTDGTFKAMDTEAQVNGGMTKLYEWFRDLEHVTAGHITNLTILRDNLTDPWELTYTGPGHGQPYDAEDIAGYDVNLYWPS